MGTNAQLRFKLCADVVDLALDGVAGYGPFSPSLGDHCPQPDARVRKKRRLRTQPGSNFQSQIRPMQCKVCGPGKGLARQNCLKLRPCFQSLHVEAHQNRKLLRQSECPKNWPIKTACEGLDSQALAAFGTARIDHSATTAGLHADQKAVGTGAADFGRLVCAFHLYLCSGPRKQSGKPKIMANFLNHGNTLDKILVPKSQQCVRTAACG